MPNLYEIRKKGLLLSKAGKVLKSHNQIKQIVQKLGGELGGNLGEQKYEISEEKLKEWNKNVQALNP